MSAAQRDVDRYVDDRVDEGVFRVHRDVFRDPALFDLEIRHVFEGTWAFLGLESEIDQPNDFLTTRIGRQPVVVMRDAAGHLGAFINSCRHRGAVVCHQARGNRKVHVCTYHGWSYDSGGRCIAVNAERAGAYTPAFSAESHALVSLARFGNYRGFLFGSLNADVPPLEEHLGASRTFLDLFVDQSPEGIELLPGPVTFTFDANWKTQIENATDSYHFATTHASYIGVLGRQGARERAGSASAGALSPFADLQRRSKAMGRGSFDFGRGHSATWGSIPNPETRPLYLSREELLLRVGEVRAKWMFYLRNMTIFPNLQIAENIAPQLRIIRPLSVDRTEMTAWCIGLKGESAEARRRRIRHYEEFFNPSGLATPDDVATYRDCQSGFGGWAIEWQQAYARGMAVRQTGPSPDADELGIVPESWVYGSFDLGDETCHQSAYREWKRLINHGLERERGR